MAHTFDPARADRLEDPSRYRYCSREELLELLAPDSDDVVLDLGSGTGFYTRDVAPYVDELLAVDVQHEMHALFDEHGVPENVSRITANATELPIDSDGVDAAFATMTFHEIATPRAVEGLHRVLRPDGRLAIVDWAADGERSAGPPLAERRSSTDAESMLSTAGFDIERRADRPETFTIVALA